MRARLLTSDYVRNFTFGVEDSLVSTVGLVSGIAVTAMPRPTIIITGIILIFVEAFSMSVGSLLSDNSAKEFEQRALVPLRVSVVSALVMFFSYFFSGFIVLAPYVFLPSQSALPLSVAISFVSLFALGLVSGRVTQTSPLRKGFTMAIIGGIAIIVGVTIGSVLSQQM